MRRKEMRRTSIFALGLILLIVLSAYGFAIAESFGGTRAGATTAAGEGKLTFCKDTDDHWKPIEPSDTWAAQQPFNVLVELPEPVELDFMGFIFYKQGPDGKDVEFVSEYQMQVQNKARKFSTTEGLRLPVGTYSVYAIDWTKREVTEHRGNLTEYFAKGKLTVK